MIDSMSSLRFAFLADSHIGYKYAARTDQRGRNLRVVDGYLALNETITQIIQEHEKEKITAVVHGGDIFHVSHPTISDIMFVQHQLRRLERVGIPFYGLAGNHDASDNRSEVAAVGAIDDPDRGIHALYHPYERYPVADGDVVLHAISHHGHHGDEAAQVIAVPGKINILTTHGAALDPSNDTLMRCMDSPREQIVPTELVLSDDFALRLLGHYHSRHAVGGKELNTWYAGSSLRRGFSDAEGARGWLLATITESGIKVQGRDISQRPQFDFPVVDAHDLTPSEIQDAVLANIASTRQSSEVKDDAAFDEGEAPILRQRIMNASRSTREAIDKAFLARQASHALRWQLEFMRPKAEISTEEKTNENTPTLSKSGKSGALNIEDSYLSWAQHSATLRDLPNNLRKMVGEEGQEHLKKAISAIHE